MTKTDLIAWLRLQIEKVFFPKVYNRRMYLMKQRKCSPIMRKLQKMTMKAYFPKIVADLISPNPLLAALEKHYD